MRIGLLHGVEDTFPRALIERIGELSDDVSAELVVLGGTRDGEATEYDLVLDRISHEVAYYRHWIHQVRAAGCRVVNDPARTAVEDRFFEWGVARKLGLSVPRSVLLPQKDYPETIIAGSLRNLRYPIPWDEHLEYVGTPAVLRPARFDRWGPGLPVHSLDDLLAMFDRTGRECVMLQQHLDPDRWVRCLVFGKSRIIVARYDPEYRQYLADPDYLEADLEAKIVHAAGDLAEALDYDMCSIDFGVTDGVACLADFVNPVPDLERATLTPFYFDKVVEAAAEACLEMVRGEDAAAPSAPEPDAGDASREDEAPLFAHISMPEKAGEQEDLSELPVIDPVTPTAGVAAARKKSRSKKKASRTPTAKAKAKSAKPKAKKKAAPKKKVPKKKPAPKRTAKASPAPRPPKKAEAAAADSSPSRRRRGASAMAVSRRRPR